MPESRFTHQEIPNDRAQLRRRGLADAQLHEREIEDMRHHLRESLRANAEQRAREADEQVTVLRSPPTIDEFRERLPLTMGNRVHIDYMDTLLTSATTTTPTITVGTGMTFADLGGTSRTEWSTVVSGNSLGSVSSSNEDREQHLRRKLVLEQIRANKLYEMAQKLLIFMHAKHDPRFVHMLQTDREGCPQCQHLTNVQQQLAALRLAAS